MQCEPYALCQPGVAETLWRVLDLVCVACALALPFIALRRWGGSQRNAGAILAVGCYLVMLSVVGFVESLPIPEMTSFSDQTTGNALVELSTVVGFVGVMVIVAAVASAPTEWMHNLGQTVFGLAGIVGILPVAYLGYDCVRWALSWQVDRTQTNDGLVLLITVGLAGTAALALVVSAIALLCMRRTRAWLGWAVLLSLAGTDTAGALFKLEGTSAWLRGSRLAGLDLILASAVIGSGIFMGARALDGEMTMRLRWRSLPTYSPIAPLLLVLLTAYNFDLWR